MRSRKWTAAAVGLVVGLLAVAAALLAIQDPSDRAGKESTESEPTAAPETDFEQGASPAGDPDDRRLLLVVGDTELTEPEEELASALESQGFVIEVRKDSDSSSEEADGMDIVVISKTVHSGEIADEFLTAPTGVVFWEDNAQPIEQGGEEEGEEGGGTRGLATIDVVNPEHTAWHAPGSEVYVNPDAPEELRAGLSGPIDFYTEPAEMTFAPKDGDESALAASATWVAEYGEEGNGRYVYYVIDADAGLADGTESHGRRVYFGLYDETFPLLTADGLALFEAAVAWAAADPAPDRSPPTRSGPAR